jgi:hypothetical protein
LLVEAFSFPFSRDQVLWYFFYCDSFLFSPKIVTLPLPALVPLLPLADLLLLPRKQEGEKEEERRRKEEGCTNLMIFVVDQGEVILI